METTPGGDGLPTKPMTHLEFRWNIQMKDKESCDTLHSLYLLQLALEKVRLRTIEWNKYLGSIGRTDRYTNHVDAPQVVTNVLNWHKTNPENNKFDGNLIYNTEKLYMINNVISDIGQVKKGPATKIFTKLTKDVVIETTAWLKSPQPILKLGFYSSYSMEDIKLLIFGYCRIVFVEGVKKIIITYVGTEFVYDHLFHLNL